MEWLVQSFFFQTQAECRRRVDAVQQSTENGLRSCVYSYDCMVFEDIRDPDHAAQRKWYQIEAEHMRCRLGTIRKFCIIMFSTFLFPFGSDNLCRRLHHACMHLLVLMLKESGHKLSFSESVLQERCDIGEGMR